MKKKLLSIIITFSMLLTIIGCSSKEEVTNIASSESTQNVGETTTNDESDTKDNNETGNENNDISNEDTTIGTDYSSGEPWINSNYLQNVIDNPDVSLKDNFDLAVNREWVIDNPIKSGKSDNNYIGSFEDELNSRLASIIMDDSYSDNHDAELVQTFYNSFLDWDKRESSSLESFMPYLKKIESISSYDDLIKIYTEGPLVLSTPIGFSITANPLNTVVNCIAIYEPKYFLNDPADYYNLDNMSEYTQLTYDCAKEKVSTVLSYCGYSVEEIDAIFDGAINYETLISQYIYNNSENNIQENRTKITQQVVSVEEVKNYKWFSLCSAFYESRGLTDIDTLHLSEKMDYFENLDSIITEENIDIIKDYLIAHTADTSIRYLNRDCYYKYLDIINKQNGSTGYQEEKRYAMNSTNSFLGWPLSKLYIEKYVTSEDKENVNNVITEIIEKYKTMLESEDFLSDETKKEAINKLNHIRINCMYPDNWDEYDYSNLELLPSNNFFENYIKIKQFEENKSIKEYNEPVNKDIWASTPITLNAFYYSRDNSINILPGLIGDVLYNKDMSKEEVLAKLGSVVAHEISHAFDPNGATYDADGNLNNWWTEEDYSNFNSLTAKLVSYYDSIKIWDDFNSNGELVKTEACADMAGLSTILLIAKDIEDFDYDLFFKSYARLWAANNTPEYMYKAGLYDCHPLSYLRTNITIAQFDEFYKTYDIKEGDDMYIAPEDRVKIW